MSDHIHEGARSGESSRTCRAVEKRSRLSGRSACCANHFGNGGSQNSRRLSPEEPNRRAASCCRLADLSLLLPGSRFCRCCGLGTACGFCRCGTLAGRRRRGFRGSSSSIGLFCGLLFLLFADGRGLRNADFGKTQGTASRRPSLFGLKLGNAFVAFEHVARTGQASLAPQAFVNRHVRISKSMDGRRPRRARLCGARLQCHAKTLFRSCEPKQCKRLFERLSTEPEAARAGQVNPHW